MSVVIVRLAALLSIIVLLPLGIMFGYAAIASLLEPTQFTAISALAAAAYCGSTCVFLVPSLRRAILRQTSRPGMRGLIAFLAALVLFLVLFPTLRLTRSWGGLTIYLGFILIYTLAFILPGFAYRPYRQPDNLAGPPDEPLVELPFRTEDIARWKPFGWFALPLLFFGSFQALAGVLFIAATPSPEWRALFWIWIPVTTAVFFLPILPSILMRRYSGGTGGIDSALGQKVVLILGGLGFAALFAYQFHAKTLVWGWNKLADAPFETRAFIVTEAKPRSGLKGCNARIVAFAEDRPGTTIDLCNYPREFVETLSPGDFITTTARTSFFGMSEIGLSRTSGRKAP